MLPAEGDKHVNRPLARFIVAAVRRPPFSIAFPLKAAYRADIGAGGGNERLRNLGRPNGSDAHLRGLGPRGYGSAAHGLPACESRDAGRAPPCRF